jgi:hypothetical protein
MWVAVVSLATVATAFAAFVYTSATRGDAEALESCIARARRTEAQQLDEAEQTWAAISPGVRDVLEAERRAEISGIRSDAADSIAECERRYG